MDTIPDSVPRATLTIVSRFGTDSGGVRSQLLRSARSSFCYLGIVVATIAPGCIYPAPPTWENPAKTPPQLINPLPSPTHIIAISNNVEYPTSGSVSLHIVVNENSEDNGDN